ncbi:MAG: hypothetical protein PUC38_02740 [Bacteroidales bacterium]|nr:hypothetical protein [Bacteroidales bacterium]
MQKYNQQNLPLNNRFQAADFCFLKALCCFPTIVVYLPHNCGATSPQLWCTFTTIMGKQKSGKKEQMAAQMRAT